MSIDPVAAYGEPFPEGFDTWHPDDQHSWKQEKAKQVLLGNQTNAFLGLAGDVGATIKLPDPSPTFTQRVAMGDNTTVHPTASSTPISEHLASSLAGLGLTGFTSIGEALAHVRNTAQYLGLPIGKTSRITSSGNLTNEATRFLAQQADESARGQRVFTGEEARLFDEAHTLHLHMRALMERGHTGMTTIKLPERTPIKGSNIESEGLGVTDDMAQERANRAAGEPIPTAKSKGKKGKQQSTPKPAKTPKSVDVSHVPGIVFDPAVHTPESYKEAVRLQLESAIKPPAPKQGSPKPFFESREFVVTPPPKPRRPKITQEEKDANLAELERRKNAPRPPETQNEKARRMYTENPELVPNMRPYTGQRLGIQLPDGSVHPIPDHKVNLVLLRNPSGNASNIYSLDVPDARILDKSPLTGHPIVEL